MDKCSIMFIVLLTTALDSRLTSGIFMEEIISDYQKLVYNKPKLITQALVGDFIPSGIQGSGLASSFDTVLHDYNS